MANKSQTSVNKQSLFKVKEPSLYNVIMHNDDVTTMDFVVTVLVHIFRKSHEVAEEIMMKIHTEGSAVVGTYSRDIAESKAQYTMDMARANGFPLKLTTEEA